MVNAANLALISPYFGTTLSLMAFKIPSASLDDVMVDVHKEQNNKQDEGTTTNKEEEGEIKIDDDDDDNEYHKMNIFNDLDSEDEEQVKEEDDDEEEEEVIDSNQYIRIIPYIDDTSKPVIFDVLKWKKKSSTKAKIVRLGRCPPSTINDQPVDILFLKSKVVSRYHCDIGYENGKVNIYIYIYI